MGLTEYYSRVDLTVATDASRFRRSRDCWVDVERGVHRSVFAWQYSKYGLEDRSHAYAYPNKPIELGDYGKTQLLGWRNR
jgi:hypothetical protein